MGLICSNGLANGQARGAVVGAGREEGEEETCFVCLDGQREAILLECGHGGLCVQCAKALW